MKKIIAENINLLVYDLACAAIICSGAERFKAIKESKKNSRQKAKEIFVFGSAYAAALLYAMAGADRIGKALKR